MKNNRILFIYFFLLLLVSSSFAQTPITKEEKKKAVDHFSNSQKELFKTIKGLSKEQLTFKPTAESWSVEEVVEHIAASEIGLFAALDMTLKSEINPDRRKEVQMTDDQILAILSNREQKVKTRPDMEPTNRFGSMEESLKNFKETRKARMDFIKNSTEDFRNRYFEFPFGTVDSYQLLLFISGHTNRHIDQIKEILENEAFPST